MAKQRRQRLGYGAKEYPAEYGLHVVLTKSEILGPDTAAELKRRGLAYTAAVMDGGDPMAFVFGPAPAAARDAGGLMARAVGEIRAGFDAEDSLVALMSCGDGRIYVQATDDVAKGLAAYRSLFERADGINVLEGGGMATGELPPDSAIPPGRCGCPECAARESWQSAGAGEIKSGG